MKSLETVSDENTNERVQTLKQLGDIYFIFEDFEKSIVLYKQSERALSKISNDKPDLQQALLYDKMGLANTHMFNFDLAVQFYEKSLDIYKMLVNGVESGSSSESQQYLLANAFNKPSMRLCRRKRV